MASAAPILRLALAALLATAAVAKLSDLTGTRRALADFRVPDALCAPFAVALPLVELTVAAALLPGSSARWSAIAAVALLAAFSAAIGRALARREHPDCHCFGGLGQTRMGLGALVRNALLAALGVLVVIAPGPGVAAWLGERSEAQRVAFWLGIALVCVTAVGAWFGRELLRQQGRLLLRLDELEHARPARTGLPVGAPAPPFELPAFGGGELSLDALLALGRPALLVLSDAACGPCAEAVPVIGRAQAHWRGRVSLVLLSKGSTPASEAAWAEHGLEHVAIADSHDINLSYGAPGTPAALLVSREGRIDSRLAAGLPHVAELLATPVGDSEGAIAETESMELAVAHVGGGA